MLVKLRLSKDGVIFEEEVKLKARADSTPKVLIAAAEKYLAPQNEGSPSWAPRIVLLSVSRVP